jgi:GT2 family glycosyltransferase
MTSKAAPDEGAAYDDGAAALSISVLVVNWNARDDLERCLVSLEAQTDTDFEVVVVDNGSQDGSCELVRERFSDVVLVATGENLGFAEGCNRGLMATSGSWVATLNNDAEADPHWIETLRRVARQGGDDLGMVQSRILFRKRPGFTNSTGVLIHRDGTFIDRDFDQPVDPHARLEEVFCASAGAALYRREMLDSTILGSGYFDRTFFMYFEDVDLGWRCRLAGWRALYAPEATVLHDFHGSSSRQAAHFVRLHCCRNRVRTMLKNASLIYIARCVPRMAYEATWAALRVGPVAIVDYAAAVRDGLRQRPAVTKLMRTPRRELESRWLVR